MSTPEPTTVAEQTTVPAVDAARGPGEAGTKGGVWEWFWRGRALRQARAFQMELPLAERVALNRAQTATELADRAFDPIDPLRSGSSLPLAISLYREAAYWALLAQSEAFSGANLSALFASVPSDLLEFAAGGQEPLRAVERALVSRNFVDTANLPAEAVPQDAAVGREFVHALLRRKLAPEARVGKLLLQRTARTFGLTTLLAGMTFGAVLTVQHLTLKPDLAAGRPWRASSSLDTCRPQEHYCASARTDIFFCTVEEKNPWVEIDLGKPTTFSAIEITNRSDCCPDRAVPLAIEVSTDQQNFKEVARRTDTFSVWKTSVPLQTARYVRLRALRRTILHLEKIVVRAS